LTYAPWSGRRDLNPRISSTPTRRGNQAPLRPDMDRRTGEPLATHRDWLPAKASSVLRNDPNYGGTAGSRTRSEWATTTRAKLLHFGPTRNPGEIGRGLGFPVYARLSRPTRPGLRNIGPPGGNRTPISRLSSARLAVRRPADGAADGDCTRDLLVGNEASSYSTTAANIGWGGGNRTPVASFKDSRPAIERRPNVVPARGFEPLSPEGLAGLQPVEHFVPDLLSAGECWWTATGVEPASPGCKPGALPLSYAPMNFKAGRATGSVFPGVPGNLCQELNLAGPPKIGGSEGSRTLISRVRGGRSPIELRTRKTQGRPGRSSCSESRMTLPRARRIGGGGGNRTRYSTMPSSRDPGSPHPHTSVLPVTLCGLPGSITGVVSPQRESNPRLRLVWSSSPELNRARHGFNVECYRHTQAGNYGSPPGNRTPVS
jgi:hypothetical protein